MGDSMPPPATFDLVDSFARLRGSDVELVLGDLKTDTASSGSLAMTLNRGKVQVTARAEFSAVDGTRQLLARLPRQKLTDGVWSLAIESETSDRQGLAARLLVQGDRPLVLLWGAKANKTVEPKRRQAPSGHQQSAAGSGQAPNGRQQSTAGSGQAPNGRQRSAAAGGRVLDRGLQLLPPGQAVKVRERARAIARRVLG